MKGFPYSFSVVVLLLAGAVAGFSQTPQAAAALNGASYAIGEPVAPGSLISIFGTNLASTTAVAGSVPFSSTLSNVKVTFNGIAAPISGVFPNPTTGDQINAQLPWEILPLLPPGTNGTVQMVVTNNNVSSTPISISVAPSAPGIFTTNGAGFGQAIAYGNVDYLFAAPAGAISGLTTHPAKIQDPTQDLVILATGLGAADTTVKDGDVPSVPTSKTLVQPTILIGNVPAKIDFCGLVGRDSTGAQLGFVGVYQINVTIQPGTPTGDAVPIQIQMGSGTPSTNKVTIAVSN